MGARIICCGGALGYGFQRYLRGGSFIVPALVGVAAAHHVDDRFVVGFPSFPRYGRAWLLVFILIVFGFLLVADESSLAVVVEDAACAFFPDFLRFCAFQGDVLPFSVVDDADGYAGDDDDDDDEHQACKEHVEVLRAFYDIAAAEEGVE